VNRVRAVKRIEVEPTGKIGLVKRQDTLVLVRSEDGLKVVF